MLKGDRASKGAIGWAIKKVVLVQTSEVPCLVSLMLITPLYAAILGFVFIALSVRTLRLRRYLKVAIGDGEQPLLARAARVHANFAEYVPLSLLLLYFLETQTGSSPWLHVLCSALVIGRTIHALGVSQVEETYRYRVIGMALTLTVIAAASIGLLSRYVLHVAYSGG